MTRLKNFKRSESFFNEKSVSQFLEGVSFFNYIAHVVSFDVIYKESNHCKLIGRKFFPFLNFKSSINCRPLNKGFLKKDGLFYPYIGLLKRVAQIQHNVPFVCNFFLSTFYTQSSRKKNALLTLHCNFLFKRSFLSLLSFDFFRTVVLSRLYKLNQFISSNIVSSRDGVLFRFRFHEVLLRSFFITSMLDENVDQQMPAFKFFQFLNEFDTLNEPLILDLFFKKTVVEFNIFDNKRFFVQILSFFGFFFSNQFSKQISNKFFIKLI